MSDEKMFKIFNEDEISEAKIKELIKNRSDFSINSRNLSRVATKLEKIIESLGFSCRIYTENRAASIGVGLFSGVAGAAAAIGIAAHNLATFNPDFEIGKNLIDNRVNVTYKKK